MVASTEMTAPSPEIGDLGSADILENIEEREKVVEEVVRKIRVGVREATVTIQLKWEVREKMI